jgi:hypothetical protein
VAMLCRPALNDHRVANGRQGCWVPAAAPTIWMSDRPVVLPRRSVPALVVQARNRYRVEQDA